MENTTEKLEALRDRRDDVSNQLEKVNFDIKAEKARISNAAIEGGKIDPAELQRLEAQAAAINSALLGLDGEIERLNEICEQEEMARKRAYIEQLSEKANQLIIEAGADFFSAFNKLIEINKIKIEAYRLKAHGSPVIKSNVDPVGLDYLNAVLVNIRSLSKLHEENMRIYEKCQVLLRTV